MNRQLNTVAVIPARGGSKGVPRKNIRPLNGKPAITYTIEAALDCKCIDRVIVSTDCSEIAEVARSAGALVPFIRPSELAGDLSHTGPVLQHAINVLEMQGQPIDVIVTLQPTSPLRKAGSIERAIQLLHEGNFDSVVSVRENDFPPYWSVRIVNSKLEPVFDDGVRRYFQCERQELPKSYRLNGAVYVTRRKFLMEDGILVVPENCGVIEMDMRESMDIDTIDDFVRIENLLSAEGLH